MDSYAYNPNNAGHIYIRSRQFEEDLKRVAEQLEKERKKHGNRNDTGSRHT